MATLKESTLEENYQKQVIEYDLTKNPVFIGCACRLCNVTVSTNHKFELVQKCKCSNEVRIIGGFENPRIYAKNIKHTFVGVITDDQDFDLVRQYASRGIYDSNNNLIFIRLNKLSNKNLEIALLQGGPEWHLKLLAKEIQYRFENKINIE
jgi:hypothetical protein